MQAEAIRQGLHTALLDCVATSHALLAVKAVESQQRQQAAGLKAGRRPQHAALQHQGPAQARIQYRSSSNTRRVAVAGKQAEAGQQLVRSGSARQSPRLEMADGESLHSHL